MKDEKKDQLESDFPGNLSQPARRALAGAGYTKLEQLAEISEADLGKLHGMGPKGIRQLREALNAKGLSFATGNNANAKEQSPKTNPTIERLASLVGEWRTEILMPLDPPIATTGQTTFEWTEQGPFLIQRGSVENTDFPTSTAIIGCDDTTDAYRILYFDSRGIARIYEMSLSKEVWKLWREAPGFSQRFTGRFSDDGNTITGYWEKSSDGSNWEHDFDLTYTKVK